MLEPTKDDSGTYDDEINPFKEFKGSEESLEEEELGLRRDFEVTAGTGKIIVDTFGWYIVSHYENHVSLNVSTTFQHLRLQMILDFINLTKHFLRMILRLNIHLF